MINVQIETVGTDKVAAKFRFMPRKMNMALTKAITILTIELKNHVVRDKLTNNVLNVRTGNLRRSIQQKVTSQQDSVVGEVFSAGDVKYAAIHEYGGTINMPARQQEINNRVSASGDFKKGFSKQKNSNFSRTVKVGAHTIVMPERSYLRSSLKDFQDKIKSTISIAVNEGSK